MIKMKNTLAIILPLVLLYTYSCNTSTGQKLNGQKFGLEFIELCIDSTLRIDPGTSVHIFYVDFSKVNSIDSNAIHTYLVLHKSIRTANLDSLFKNDSMWTKYGYFNIPVIRFEKITTKGADSIIVETSKHKASDGSNGVEIILIRSGNGFKCLSSGMTWIS